MSDYELVLATDLDGTFLEGNEEVKEYFYTKLVNLKQKILLIYTTGRPVSTVKYFCEMGFLPVPHFILGDHGTHIVDDNFDPIISLQNSIVQTWNEGNNKLKNLLCDESGIQLQPIDPPYRVAYYYDQEKLEQTTIEKIERAGYDSVLSCDMYLDILPKGVNKGSTLMRLLQFLKISPEVVITAGDSLNDLSLFQTGLKSIVVGNAEPKLIPEISLLENVYHSKLPGLFGILDGLSFYEKNYLFN